MSSSSDVAQEPHLNKDAFQPQENFKKFILIFSKRSISCGFVCCWFFVGFFCLFWGFVGVLGGGGFFVVVGFF